MNEEAIKEKYEGIQHVLNERSRRMWAAVEARAIGRGGVTRVHRATGIGRTTIHVGLKELAHPTQQTDVARIRHKGGGRHAITQIHPTFEDALFKLIEPTAYGDPESPLRWTTKSLKNLVFAMSDLCATSPTTIRHILKKHKYHMQNNRKRSEGTNHPDRDKQFRYINETVKAQQQNNQPCISVDTKKKENVGNYRNSGAEWCKQGEPIEVNMHDFPDKELGKAIPYGVYDIIQNNGCVNVGVTSDTAHFAVNGIRTWWKYMGKKRYSNATELTITADSGGSNSARSRLWKLELQKFANKTGLTIHVCHFPPGTSKWNKIEHRLFSVISGNWRGTPLDSLTTIVNLIGNTTTETGLTVKAVLDERVYETGIKVSDEDLARVNITRNTFHGEWNYTIAPRV